MHFKAKLSKSSPPKQCVNVQTAHVPPMFPVTLDPALGLEASRGSSGSTGVMVAWGVVGVTCLTAKTKHLTEARKEVFHLAHG